MKIFAFLICFTQTLVYGQNKIDSIVNYEYQQGHFNGSILAIKDGKVINNLNKGFANFQFKVPINSNTKFPIASTTKLFTTLCILKLHEKSLLSLNDKISKYVGNLPENCRDILISDLLIHYSGLANEPIKAYLTEYKLDSYIRAFVVRKQSVDTVKFNYNNVDYILLSKVIENVTNKPFSKAIQAEILTPLKLVNTGFVDEGTVTPNLAYGYHNYSFGSGKVNDPLYNDQRYISNYFGAGQIYSTTEDLYSLIKALSADKLISKQSRMEYLVKPQKHFYVDWLEGEPTYGFYFDNKSYNDPVLRRSGNIDGFNSEIMTNKDFTKIVIVLCNTDTGNVAKICNQIFYLMID